MSEERNRQILPLFARPIYIVKNYTLTKEEREQVDKEKEIKMDNAGKNFTSANSHVLENPIFKGLNSFLQQEVDKYFHEELQYKRSSPLRITQSWFNYNPKGTFHHSHTHPNSIISGVYFVQGDRQPIVFERFENDHMFGGIIPEADKYNFYNCGNWKVTSKPGYLLLFPSSVKHGVVMNEHPEERISLSFNTFLTGIVGKARGLTELKL